MKKEQQKKLSQEEKGLLVAICLGDGHLHKPHPKTKSVQLEIGHSVKQLDYCTYKRDLVHDILGKESRVPKVSIRNVKIKGKEYETCRFVKTCDYFFVLRNLLYPNGRKVITREILDMLSPKGLAIWYMDDGSCYFKDSPIDGHSICIDLRISTDCFTSEEHDIMVEYFREVWNINFYKFYSKSRDVYCLRANKEAALKFIELIKSYIIPSMKYKINLKLQECKAPCKNEGEDIV